MTHQIAIIIANVSMALLWALSGFDERFTVGVVFLTILFNVLGMISAEKTLRLHHDVLSWFAENVHVNPKSVPEGIPQDLLDLVERGSREEHRKP